MTSPFDRSQPDRIETAAWQPLIDGVEALGTVVTALAVVVERLSVLVDELRKLVAGRDRPGPLPRKMPDAEAADERQQDRHRARDEG